MVAQQRWNIPKKTLILKPTLPLCLSVTSTETNPAGATTKRNPVFLVPKYDFAESETELRV
jgi:hypothetical protein